MIVIAYNKKFYKCSFNYFRTIFAFFCHIIYKFLYSIFTKIIWYSLLCCSSIHVVTKHFVAKTGNNMMLYFLVFRQTSILTFADIKTHSKSRYNVNSAFLNFLKFWQLIYSFSSRNKTDFLWLIDRQFFTWNLILPS